MTDNLINNPAAYLSELQRIEREQELAKLRTLSLEFAGVLNLSMLLTLGRHRHFLTPVNLPFVRSPFVDAGLRWLMLFRLIVFDPPNLCQ